MTTMQDHWAELVAVAMLGTDRRNPPDAPDPIADIVDDTVRDRSSDRMLAQVAAAVAARRAGVLPGAPARPLAPPDPDERRTVVPAAVERWFHITTAWPVLEDEWMLTVVTNGWRLPPELVPDVLARHRKDPVRRARAMAACGPLATWLVGHVPALATRGRSVAVDLESVGEVPDLPIPGELVSLLGADGVAAGHRLATSIDRGELVHAHRAVLINLVARVRPDGLAEIERALGGVGETSIGHALASVLADLATTRRQMLDELS
ncbi:MAG: hypothetical protein WBP59_17235 [Ilumatobacteraceae bacterium]